MTIEVDVQRASESDFIPPDDSFQSWAEAVLTGHGNALLTIRIVDLAESAELNLKYRARQGATNVLSFEADLPPEIDLPLLGDIVICAPLVAKEAEAQGKEPNAHWAHLVIHGVLHLLGFDHQTEPEAAEMELRELAVLDALGFPDPYC